MNHCKEKEENYLQKEKQCHIFFLLFGPYFLLVYMEFSIVVKNTIFESQGLAN